MALQEIINRLPNLSSQKMTRKLLYNINKNIIQAKQIHIHGMGLKTNITVWALYSQLINETSLRIENTTEPQIVLLAVCACLWI